MLTKFKSTIIASDNIKETKRLVALKNELTKLGANLDVTETSFKLYKTREIQKNITI